jgi:hypothetical protein
VCSRLAGRRELEVLRQERDFLRKAVGEVRSEVRRPEPTSRNARQPNRLSGIWLPSRDGWIRTRDPLNPIRIRGAVKNGKLSVFERCRASVPDFYDMHVALCREKRTPKRTPLRDAASPTSHAGQS